MVNLESDQTNDRDINKRCKTDAEAKRGPTFLPPHLSQETTIAQTVISSSETDFKNGKCSVESNESPQASFGRLKPKNKSNATKSNKHRDTLEWWQRTRVLVALLGLAIAVVNCYAQATFCIAIVEMVLPADYTGPRGESSSTPSPNTSASATTTTTTTGVSMRQELATNATNLILMGDQSCPIEFKYRNYYDTWRFGEAEGNQQQQLQSNQPIDISNRFDWDASQQGLLLGAFAVGTAPLQIIGGRLAEIYGSKWVLLMGCVGTGLTNLAIPFLARYSFLLLLANRILMGVAQAGMEPGLICLLADWLTPPEASFFISMLLFAICLGFFLGSLCSSFLLALGYGWPLAYYICGGLNLVVALVWYVYADSWPRSSKYITKEELHFITSEQAAAKQTMKAADQPTIKINQELILNSSLRVESTAPAKISSNHQAELPNESIHVTHVRTSDEQELVASRQAVDCPPAPDDPLRAPWLRILSSRPVWAFIICKISIRWCADVISNELPTYLANVLHLSIKINGLLNSVSSALFAISSFLTGWLATSSMFASKTSQNKTNLRKGFQSLASFGSAICLILMTRYDCDIPLSMSCLLALSCFIVMGTGGELQIAYDMTSRYPGTLHGMACTLSVSGWLAPPLYGLILGDQPSSRARWSIVWYSTAAISLFGGLVFVLFADARPKNFDKPARRKRNINDGQPGYGGYLNDALSGSSCESSPKSNHSSSLKGPLPQPATSGPIASKINPLEASISFDCGKLIKCRQSESSFIQARMLSAPGYCSDSPLQLEANDLIYPFRESADYNSQANSNERKPSGSVWSRLASLALRVGPTKPPHAAVATDHWEEAKSISKIANELVIETLNQSEGSHDSDVTRGRRLASSPGGQTESAETITTTTTAAVHQSGIPSVDHTNPTSPQPVDPSRQAAAAVAIADSNPNGHTTKQTDFSPLLVAGSARQKTITHL